MSKVVHAREDWGRRQKEYYNRIAAAKPLTDGGDSKIVDSIPRRGSPGDHHSPGRSCSFGRK